MQAGYFMFSLEPMLPSIHSMAPLPITLARLVTRLMMLSDQFCTVE